MSPDEITVDRRHKRAVRGSLTPVTHEPDRCCAVTRDEVRAAILWALEHDVATLAQHREVAHTVLDESRRRRSDAALVARWRQATARPTTCC
jgi:hypothetical protein